MDRCAAATAGSAGVDLATAVDITLTTSEVKLIDSDQQGPLGHGLSALLIGRSSISRKGIFIVPGLIDADFCGTIKIMVYTLTPPLTIPAQSKIAQLIPFHACVPKAHSIVRGHGGFGSTGVPNVLLAIDIAKGKPEERVTLRHPNGQSLVLSMLIDTGADVTIVPITKWPRNWPLVPAATSVVGVGGAQCTMISKLLIAFNFEDGTTVTTRPYVMHLPVALIGRDILSQMGAKLVTQHF